MAEITVQELSEKIREKEKFALLDVREREEHQIARIPGSRLIPLGEIARRAHELDAAEEIVVHCKMGGRSAKAIHILQQMGFRKLKILKGGIDSWSAEIDSSVPKY